MFLLSVVEDTLKIAPERFDQDPTEVSLLLITFLSSFSLFTFLLSLRVGSD